MASSNSIDKWLMRSKDVIIVFGAIVTFLAYGLKFYGLPKEVEANALGIKEAKADIIILHEVDVTLGRSITELKYEQKYIAKGVDEIKDLVKTRRGV